MALREAWSCAFLFLAVFCLFHPARGEGLLNGLGAVTAQLASNWGAKVTACNVLTVVLYTDPASALRFNNAKCDTSASVVGGKAIAYNASLQTISFNGVTEYGTRSIDCSLEVIDTRGTSSNIVGKFNFKQNVCFLEGGDMTLKIPAQFKYDKSNAIFGGLFGDAQPGRVAIKWAAQTAPSACNKSRSYTWDEALSAGGANRCTNDCACDGQRTCKQNRCEGIARCPTMDKSPMYIPPHGYEQGFCDSDCDCAFNRVCNSKRECQSVWPSRCSSNADCFNGTNCNQLIKGWCCPFAPGDEPDDDPTRGCIRPWTCPKTPAYMFTGKRSGGSMCTSSCECDGESRCTVLGQCIAKHYCAGTTIYKCVD